MASPNTLEFITPERAVEEALKFIDRVGGHNLHINAALQRLKQTKIIPKSSWSLFDRATGLKNVTTVNENEIHLATDWTRWAPFDRAANLIHEERHLRQYSLTSTFNFYTNYIVSEMFRLRMEVEAEKEELRFYKVAGMPPPHLGSVVLKLLNTHAISQKHYLSTLEDIKKWWVSI